MEISLSFTRTNMEFQMPSAAVIGDNLRVNFDSCYLSRRLWTKNVILLDIVLLLFA